MSSKINPSRRHFLYALFLLLQIPRALTAAEIETASTVHELVAPVTGTVLAVNPHLEDHPAVINEDPYSDGWLIEVRLKDQSEIDGLMDMDEYYHFVFKDKA